MLAVVKFKFAYVHEYSLMTGEVRRDALPELPKGAKLSDVAIPRDVHWLARYDGRLLGGVVALDGVAHLKTVFDWSGQLYRELQPVSSKNIKVSLIPYAVWGNRGSSEMSVWLPLD